MSDDLNEIKQMLDRATPSADPTRKAENIALAQKNFADLQGSRDPGRPTADRPKTGLISGVRSMLTTLTSRGGLTASTALVAVGLIVMTPLGEILLSPGAMFEESRNKAFREGPAPVARPKVPETPVIVESAAPVVEAPVASNVLESAAPALDAVTAPDSMAEISQQPAIAPEPRTEQMPAPQFSNQVQAAPRAQASELGALLGIAAGTTLSTSNKRKATSRRAVQRQPDPQALLQSNTESFANEAANPLRITTETPVSTFSIDVDTASYAVVRNSLTRGQLPPRDAVRIEEMINYFPYDYASPTGADAFQPTVTLTQTPWNTGTRLLQIGIQGAQVTERPPLNLVFLIDTSGSMNRPGKLPLLKQSFRLMLSQLRPEDEVAIVSYAGSAGQVLAPTPASDRAAILNALERLEAGGGTAGQAGLQKAYGLAATMTEDGDVTRVILATDGDFNVGLSDPKTLKDYIADKRDSGTYLSVLGFGRGNLDDATMQALAQNGNGQAAYIDTLSEAQKVLVDQLTGALFPIANDVKIQIEFNPASVSEYRLIGYETRALRREDFNNDKVDAGDIGTGHQVTALYEITPVGSDAELTDPLRYGAAPVRSESDELAFLRLRYKAPGADTSELREVPITSTNAGDPSFAAAIAGFGQLLRNGTYTGDWRYADAITLANQTKGDDPFGYRAEAIRLMRLAESLSQN